MKVKDLIRRWEESGSEVLTEREYAVRLPVRDAARLAALTEIYPSRTFEQLVTELLGAALDEIEEALPYVQGARVISVDDQGDPIYEDAGPSARFRDLAEKHVRDLAGES